MQFPLEDLLRFLVRLQGLIYIEGQRVRKEKTPCMLSTDRDHPSAYLLSNTLTVVYHGQ